MITSTQNPRVKAAARLRDARQRAKQQRIIIDGARELLRALQAGVEVNEVFVCEALCRSDDCHRLLNMLSDAHSAEIVHVAHKVFEKLAFGARAEGVVGVARAPALSLADIARHIGESSAADPHSRPGQPRPRGLIAVLEGVEKPGNLGAVLRTADAAGVSALILADGATDLYNPNAIRASLGTIFAVPVCAASSNDAVSWLRANNLAIYAARVDAEVEYTAADFTRPCAIVLGSEANGLSDHWREHSAPTDATANASSIKAIKLPMFGVADSLNVSTSAAVLFYEALRQRRRIGL
jgi:TrmH family RNA methyltransferase